MRMGKEQCIYAKLAKCSTDAALRGIKDLKERGILEQNVGKMLEEGIVPVIVYLYKHHPPTDQNRIQKVYPEQYGISQIMIQREAWHLARLLYHCLAEYPDLRSLGIGLSVWPSLPLSWGYCAWLWIQQVPNIDLRYGQRRPFLLCSGNSWRPQHHF